MRALLILSIIPLMTVGIWYYRLLNSSPIPTIQANNLVSISEPTIATLFNNKNKNFHNFSCDLSIKINRHHLRGSIKYEKPKNFWLEMSSVLGPELLMGSNTDVFWYWSKRSPEKGLFFARHENYDKTLLKSMFNPRWLMSSLGLDELPSGGKYFERDKELVVVYGERDTLGRSVTRCIFIDREFVRFRGMMLLDENGQTLAVVEVLDYQYSLPKQISYYWVEEGVSMLFELESVHINQNLDSNWEMPNICPVTDIGKT